MFVIDVIPLSAGIPSGTLSYRSKKRVGVGTLVQVPLRAKTINALVVGITSVVEAKASIKTAGFALRGGKLKTGGRLPEWYLLAGSETADYHGVSIGSVLGALLKEVLPEILPKTFGTGDEFKEIFVEDTYEKRVEEYKKLVAGQREKAVLITAPTLVEAERLFETFKKEGAVLFTGTLRGKHRDTALTKALASKSVVVTTPGFAWMPVEKLGSIIIERASANGYTAQKRPYLDMRVALRFLAEKRGLTIAYGDFPLPIELRPKPGAALRAAPCAPALLIDPRKEQKETAFSALPRDLLGAITATHAAGGRSAILAVRKGHGSAVVCRDCGNTLRDERGAGLSLATVRGKRILRSADGATKLDADAVCSVCGSWNLMPLGIGVESVIAEIAATLPAADIIRFDTDTIKTNAQAKTAAKRMNEPKAIVVGTEIMLPYFDPALPFELSAIASADTLLALPFWRARERLVRIGLVMRTHAERFILSTRMPEEVSIDAILHPEQTAFFKEETDIRKALSYPPFGHLLVFHSEGTQAGINAAALKIDSLIQPNVGVRLADRNVKRGVRLSIVAKFKNGAWPDEALSKRLSMLPPSVSTHVDPESLW